MAGDVVVSNPPLLIYAHDPVTSKCITVRTTFDTNKGQWLYAVTLNLAEVWKALADLPAIPAVPKQG